MTVWVRYYNRRFYPRHPRGWRRFTVVLPQSLLDVSIHATLAGGDWGNRHLRAGRGCFYPRHPRGWRHAGRPLQAAEGMVSIHATLAGGDSFSTWARFPSMLFLSTPPSRVATVRRKTHVILLSVSIHATLAGGDVIISAELDVQVWFLSTPPSRVATALTRICKTRREFLSTPPSRVATLQQGHHHAEQEGFYPRHPRGWRRSSFCLFSFCLLCFYPRHPRGWRHPHNDPGGNQQVVSIHATLAGGDTLNLYVRFSVLKFLSTPPSRVATDLMRDADSKDRVSIHATLAGGD